MRNLLLCIVVLALGIPSAHAQKKEVDKLDVYFNEMLQEWNIPGMAVAIVKDGETLLAKGYGVKDVNTLQPVDAQTQFAIASNTKAFTAAALAVLVDQGKLNWDDKVRKFLPDFELYDPYVSANMTIRDLLCHRSGLETFSGDLIWYGSTHSREEVLRRAKYLKPVYGFRAHFGYSNIMYLAAGLVVEQISGLSWDDFVAHYFFAPLGMERTLSSVADFPENGNISSPHNEVDGENVVIDWVNWDNIAPAGSIVASVDELCHWMNLQLNKGKIDSTVFWSEKQAEEMWRVNTPENISAWSAKNFPSKTFSGYALGWDIFNYHGKKIVNHSGGYDGFISKTILIPESNMGIVILTNNVNFLPSALMYQILDVFFAPAAKTDWGRQFLTYKKMDEESKLKNEVEAEAARIKDTKPTLGLEAYTGTYGGEMYGNCQVNLVDGKLTFQFEPTPLFHGYFSHWHYDTFQLHWDEQMMLPSGTVQFIIGADAQVEEMKIDVPNPDFDFTELLFKKL